MRPSCNLSPDASIARHNFIGGAKKVKVKPAPCRDYLYVEE
jgi:hypothetical protein